MGPNRVVVIDLDNTLVDYDDLFFEMAREREWIAPGCARDKASIKNAVGDDERWRELQHLAYSREIHRAKIPPAAFVALDLLRRQGLRPVIVSHKTERSRFDGRTDLREPALNFLKSGGVMDSLGPEDLFFTETFEEKVDRILRLSPALVIDDLDRVIESRELLRFNRVHLTRSESNAAVVARSWEEIADFLHVVRVLKLDFRDLRFVSLPAKSRNRIFRMEGANRKYAVKIFPRNERGRLSARNEKEASEILERFGVRQVVKVAALHGTCAAFEWIDGGEADPILAYSALSKLLKKTRGLPYPRRVQDDAGTKGEFVSGLKSRLSELELPGDMRKRVESAISEAEKIAESFDVSGETRFLLSDFSPANTILSPEGGVHFLDLEDAGLGNPHRMLANLALHPRSALRRDGFESLGKDLELSPETTKTVFLFSYLEWVCILLGCFSRSRFETAPDTAEMAARQARADRRLRFFFDVGPDKECLYEKYWLHREELR